MAALPPVFATLRTRDLPSRLRGGKLEAIKWIAFALMLVDHFAAYVAGVVDPFAEFAGAMVLPLFAFALAVGIAPLRSHEHAALTLRMFGWAFVAQLGAVLVREPLPVNVLFTFGAALLVDWSADKDAGGWERALALVGGLFVGYVSEFSYPGVALIVTLIWWARSGDARWLWLTAAAAVLLTIPNASVGALFAPVVVALVLWLGLSLPRIGRVFYPLYAVQFGVCALLAWAL